MQQKFKNQHSAAALWERKGREGGREKEIKGKERQEGNTEKGNKGKKRKVGRGRER